MKKVILTKGLPASGKTTWAKDLIDKEPGTWKRINKDDLRAMLDNGKWSKSNEQFVLDVRNYIIDSALFNGYNVIIDDTNLHPKHETAIKAYCQGAKVQFEIKDFTDVPLEECIKRDQKRANYVGEKVIRQMYNQFLKPKPEVVRYDLDLPDAIICDIDGTTALFGDRSPYERDFMQDEVNEPILEILNRVKHDRVIIFVSGRMDKVREQTIQWFEKHNVHFDFLYMRKTDDVRSDEIIKREIYESEIKGKYNVQFVLDDRNRVVDMWRQVGLTCLQVAPGDF